jgi:hypothetical protein
MRPKNGPKNSPKTAQKDPEMVTFRRFSAVFRPKQPNFTFSLFHCFTALLFPVPWSLTSGN